MATEVTLPQLGESVTEGTITAWLVEVGDTVEADQPLFELSSDKIDTEVPAPAAGVLKEIKVGVDETVDVGTVVAIIGDADDGGGAAPAEAEEAPAEDAEQEAPAADAEQEAPAEEEAPAEDAASEEAASAEERKEVVAEKPAAAASDDGDSGGNGQAGAAVLSSPLVRRMAADAGLDLSAVKGSGEGGRVTREDVEAAIAKQGKPAEEAKEAKDAKAPAAGKPAAPSRPAARPSGERQHTEDLSRIRQRIAAKMMESMSSTAQLTTVQEADVTGIMLLRERVKDTFKQREGASLSPFAFLCRAAVIAVRNHPTINAHADWEAGKVTYRDYVNLGIAVDSDKGLIVPNIKGADELTVAGLARAIVEVADKARGVTKLEMSDIEGGTFTVTNTGSRGVLIDTPILNYPEVAILGTGAIKKRPVVMETETGDAIAVRSMVYLCLTYDHRLIDGADAARYVTEVRDVLETHDWAAEIGY